MHSLRQLASGRTDRNTGEQQQQLTTPTESCAIRLGAVGLVVVMVVVDGAAAGAAAAAAAVAGC